jgi:predicted nuclease of predicted toxin-antitoxin system
MRVLVDMNLSPAWAKFLSDKGISATHWSGVGAANAADREIMAYAAEHNYIVLTHDLDFGAILAANQGDKPSVIQIRSDDLRPETIGTAVVTALRNAEAELDAGALVSVEPHRTRLRILPFKTR